MSDVSSTPSGMTGAGGGSMIRITGMASGLDVDSMVKKMMIPEQMRVDVVKQDRQYIQWKQEAYQDIIKDLKDLQSSYFDVTNGDNYLLASNNYSGFDLSYGTAGVLTATATTGAVTGNYQVNVDHLAQSAVIHGSSLNSQVLVDPNNLSANWAGKTININIGTTGTDTDTITIPSGPFSSVEDLAAQINNQITTNNPQLNGKLAVSVISDGTNEYLKFNANAADNISISSTQDPINFPTELTSLEGHVLKTPSLQTTLGQLGYTGAGSTLNLSYNGTSISGIQLTASSTLGDLINAINKNSSGNITANIDDLTGMLNIQTKSTGSTSSLVVNGDNSILKSLGLIASNDNTTTSISNSGVDAKLTITQPNGSSSTITEGSNIFTLNGVTYNLNSAGSTSVNVSPNVDKVFDRIKGFIDKYNAIVEKIHGKLNEKKNYDYKPLTDSQKAQMKDSDIQAWQDKAKQGVVRNDNNLESMLTDLRTAFFSQVTGSNAQFGRSIGLDTSGDVSTGGKIVFTVGGESTFKAALRDNPKDIMNLFMQSSISQDPTTKYNNEGIFQRINDIIVKNVGLTGSTYNSGILTQYANMQDDFSTTGGAGNNTLPDQLYTKDQLIKSMTDALSAKQESYYQQFSKLDTAMSQINSQSAWLTQQLGG